MSRSQKIALACSTSLLLAGFVSFTGIRLVGETKKMPDAQCISKVMENLPEVSQIRIIPVRAAKKTVHNEPSPSARKINALPSYSSSGGLVPYVVGSIFGLIIVDAIESPSEDKATSTEQKNLPAKEPIVEYEQAGFHYPDKGKEFVSHTPKNHIIYEYLLKEREIDDAEKDWNESGELYIEKTADGLIRMSFGNAFSGSLSDSHKTTIQEIALRLKTRCGSEFKQLRCLENHGIFTFSSTPSACADISAWLAPKGIVIAPPESTD